MVIMMRTFYLYQINDLCKDLYSNYPYKLYHILKDIYYTSKYNQPIAISSYEQVTDKFNKQYLDNFIFQKYRLDLYYLCKGHIHTISSHQEYSKLMVSSYSLKLKTNLSFSSFFPCICQYNSSIFVCDFENNDYFWLNKIINREETLIKS